MRPKSDDGADVVMTNGRRVDARDHRRTDPWRQNGDQRGATARAEAGAGMRGVMVGGRAVLVRRVPRMRRDEHRGVLCVLRAMVERARVEKRTLKPDGPDAG